jgi:hypothetical protein
VAIGAVGAGVGEFGAVATFGGDALVAADACGGVAAGAAATVLFSLPQSARAAAGPSDRSSQTLRATSGSSNSIRSPARWLEPNASKNASASAGFCELTAR